MRRVRGLSAQLDDVLLTGLAACAIAAIAAFFIPALFRLSYPFPLESTEQASLEQVRRVVQGQPLYVAPTLQHVPLVYAPLYYYVSAPIAALVGVSYTPMRLVSLLASAASLGLIAYLVTRETRRRLAGLASAGLLAATYPLSSTALDVAHVDALFVFLVLAGLVLARTRGDPLALAASGILLGLAGLTKLPIGAAPVVAAVVTYLVIAGRPAAAASCALGFIATLAVGLLALRVQAGPWPTWYVLELPAKHVINNHGDLLPNFWLRDILPRFSFVLLIGPVFPLVRAVDGHRRPLLFYSLVILSLIAVAWAARSNSGGAPNVLVPGHVAIALLFGLGLDALLRLLSGGSARVRTLRAYLLGLCIVQFALLVYNPRVLAPYRSEQWAAERLSTTLANLDGQLFAPNLDGYVSGSDKGEQPLVGAVLEITGSYGGLGTAEGDGWKRELATALREHRYGHVVLIEQCCEISEALAQNGYVAVGPLFPPNDEYWLWTNGRTPSDLKVFVPGTANP